MRKILVACLTLFAIGCTPSLDGYVSDDWWAARQLEYILFAGSRPLNPSSTSQLMMHLEREALGDGFDVPDNAVPEDAWDGVIDKMWRLRDTSDFDALRFVDLLYAHRGDPAVPEALWVKAEEALLTFKYWYDDPTPTRIVDGSQVVDDMWYWTENHILIFKTCEFLAGQMFPNRTFEVSGLTGAEHQARALPFILTWLDERSRFGFTEWHSNTYYNLDMRPLLSLVEWSDDPTVALRASMVLDLVMLDTALHLHRGTFGATHGRAYIKDKASASTEDTFDTAKMLFNDTVLPYASAGSTSGAVWARAKKYKLPEVIRRIAKYDGPMVDRERMNLPLDEIPPADLATAPPPEAPFGFDYRDEEYLPFWWSMNAQSVWMMLPLTFEIGERENLWDGQFAPFKALRDLVFIPGDPEGTVLFAQQVGGGLSALINQALLKEVNTYTYRTRDYMLSTAQDYRKGVRGSQTHTWQATFDENAMVFTTHPSYLPVEPGDPIPADWNWQQEDEPGPGYWTGESSQPRSAQHENVGISIYSQQYVAQAGLGFPVRRETHAYFPVAHFDEVIRDGAWTFGRKGDGYVALYSWRPVEWRGGQPEVFQNGGLDFDLVAPDGPNNVWIVECGSAEEWPGGFEEFRAAIAGSEVTVVPTAEAFDVIYQSPTQGEVEFGWEGPIRVSGTDHTIDDYPRFDNPFASVPFDTKRYEIAEGGYELVLDFDADVRSVSAPENPFAEGREDVARIWNLVRDNWPN